MIKLKQYILCHDKDNIFCRILWFAGVGLLSFICTILASRMSRARARSEAEPDLRQD